MIDEAHFTFPPHKLAEQPAHARIEATRIRRNHSTWNEYRSTSRNEGKTVADPWRLPHMI